MPKAEPQAPKSAPNSDEPRVLGKWKARHGNKWDEQEWIPDLLAIAQHLEERDAFEGTLNRYTRAGDPARALELAEAYRFGQVVWEF